jgi:mRNA interferase HicA
MKRRELEKRLRSLGWHLVRHGARHDVWSDGETEIAVPRHSDINEYTAKAILKEAERGSS